MNRHKKGVYNFDDEKEIRDLLEIYLKNEGYERFYKVEKSITSDSSGSGLGLAIAKNIVELHGGRIWEDLLSLWQELTFDCRRM